MESKFTVEVLDGSVYVIYWQGNQYNTALKEFKNAKKLGYSYVNLIWRGE